MAPSPQEADTRAAPVLTNLPLVRSDVCDAALNHLRANMEN